MTIREYNEEHPFDNYELDIVEPVKPLLLEELEVGDTWDASELVRRADAGTGIYVECYNPRGEVKITGIEQGVDGGWYVDVEAV